MTKRLLWADGHYGFTLRVMFVSNCSSIHVLKRIVFSRTCLRFDTIDSSNSSAIKLKLIAFKFGLTLHFQDDLKTLYSEIYQLLYELIKAYLFPPAPTHQCPNAAGLLPDPG